MSESVSMEARRAALLEELGALPDDEARFLEILRRARAAPGLAPGERCPRCLVEGCLSQLWLVAELEDGRCRFRCDADSAVVKGMAGLLCAFYSGATPEQVLSMDPSFLREAGITAHLSANRRNVLSRVWSILRGFAAAHVAQGVEQQ